MIYRITDETIRHLLLQGLSPYSCFASNIELDNCIKLIIHI